MNISNKSSGSSITEYAFIAALIAGVGLTGSTFLGGEVNNLFSRLSNVVTTGQESSADNLGDHTATQSLNMSGFSIIGLGSPTNDTDAATKGYVDTAVASSSGADNLGNHTATQILNMEAFRVSNVGTPTDTFDAATKGYVDSAIAGIPGGDNLGNHTATQNIMIGSNWISSDGTNSGIQISPVAVTTSSQLVTTGVSLGASGLDGYFATGSINGPASGDFTVNVGNASGSLILDNNGTQRMRLQGDAVMIGTTTTPGSGLMAGLGAAGTYWTWGPSRARQYDVYYLLNGNSTGVYLPSGSTGWFAHSDERVKNIIEPITNASGKVASLRSVIGTYKSDPDQRRRPFLIAQDVETVLPEAVFRNPDAIGTLGVSYTDIVPLLVASQKELIEEIASLKERIKDLESK